MKLTSVSVSADDFARLRPHLIAELMPYMNADEWQSLLASVRAHGLVHAVVIYEGCILDGRHRHRAYMECVRQGLPMSPLASQFDGTFDEAVAYSMSANVSRRHLTPSQRAVIAAQIAQLGRGEKQSNGAMTQTAAADMLHVSPRLVRYASQIVRSAPGVAREVREGKMTIASARKRIEPEPPPPPADIAYGQRLFDELIVRIRSLQSDLARLCAGPWGDLLDRATITNASNTIIAALTHARPDSVCARVGGAHDESCPECDGRGWVGRKKR